MSKLPSTAGLPAVHPGHILRDDVLPFYRSPEGGKATKVEIADALGVQRADLYKILDGKRAITPAMALRIAKLFGHATAETWLRLQAAYDLKVAREQLASEIDAIPTWRRAPTDKETVSP